MKKAPPFRWSISLALRFLIANITAALWLAFTVGWLMMIAVGDLHSWLPVIPAMGYWTAYWTSALFLFISIRKTTEATLKMLESL